jgi:hypothetical protein
MDAPTRTQTYEGLFPSQAEDRFRIDAAEAAVHGWRPIEKRWSGQALVVTFEHRPDHPMSETPAHTPADAPAPGPVTSTHSARGWAKVTLGAFATLAAVIASVLVAGSIPKSPSLAGPAIRGSGTIRVSAADHGPRWPLTVHDGVLTCVPYKEVILTTPDGRQYGINGSARGNDRWIDGRTIYKAGVVGADTSFLIELGLGLCED